MSDETQGCTIFIIVFILESIVVAIVVAFFWAALVPMILPNAVESGHVPWNLTIMQALWIGIAMSAIQTARALLSALLLS